MLISELTLGQLADTLKGEWLIAPKSCKGRVAGISTDSRTITVGEAFLALTGEHFNGHDFIDRALKAGAAALIISNKAAAPYDFCCEVPTLLVEDTLVAYGALGRWVRMQAGERQMLFAGVAGSNGKTTTKEMLTAIMQRQAGRDRVLKTPSNDNNLVGLPKTLLGLKASHRVGVLEVGMNQPGELFKLGKILTPDVALLTNIGTAHCGEFESVDAHFHAKMEWLESMPDHTPVIVNAECQKTKRAVDLIGDRLDFRFVSTASEPSTKSALSARLIEAIPLKSGGYRVVADVNGEQLCFELPVFGRYNIDNALMSAVAGQLLGASRHAIIEALEHFQPVNMRGEIRELAGRTFVIDCYNASPESMNKSLNSFCQMSRDRGMRAFALLGEMAELGDMTNKAHQEVGQAAADLGLTGLFTLGDQMAAAVYEANRGGVSGQSCHSLQEAGYRLMEATRPGDAILLKGSRIMHLEDVLPLIQSMESSSSQQQYV